MGGEASQGQKLVLQLDLLLDIDLISWGSGVTSQIRFPPGMAKRGDRVIARGGRYDALCQHFYKLHSTTSTQSQDQALTLFRRKSVRQTEAPLIGGVNVEIAIDRIVEMLMRRSKEGKDSSGRGKKDHHGGGAMPLMRLANMMAPIHVVCANEDLAETMARLMGLLVREGLKADFRPSPLHHMDPAFVKNLARNSYIQWLVYIKPERSSNESRFVLQKLDGSGSSKQSSANLATLEEVSKFLQTNMKSKKMKGSSAGGAAVHSDHGKFSKRR